jgi:hypothetical protein
VVTWFVVQDGPEQAKLPGGGGPTDPRANREERLRSLLGELRGSIGKGENEELAAQAGAEQLAYVDGNVARIGFRSLDLRYVAPAEQSGQQLSPAGTWVADVQVSWQFRKYDVAPSTLEVPMEVVDDGEQARFSGIAAPDDKQRVPLWLLERLSVRKSDRTLVLAADPERLPQLTRLARRAVPTVAKVLPGWTGALVLEEPSNEAVLDEAVGSDQTTTAQLAGVTTTVDGSVARGGATHVLLNPEVFGRLGPQAAQIVVSHEATHVATDAAVASMPQWLSEGFADYVALRDVDLPVSVSASQVLAEVRKNGSPRKLPASADFSGDNAALGATYESAWLACRLLAQEYGERRLVAFYRQSDRDSGTRRAFRRVLGTTEPAFTRSWSSYLAGLASQS